MKPPSKQMRDRLCEAATLRAMGAGWPAVAHRLNTRPEVCSRWPKRYPAIWQTLYETARQRLIQETWAEAFQVLLSHLRSQDEKIRHEAAMLVERYVRESGQEFASNWLAGSR